MWVQRGEGLSQGGPGETEPGKDMAGSVMATGRPESKGLKGKLQAQVYNILPSTTAVFSYDTGSRKLSALKRAFFLFSGAQTVVGLLQTTIRRVISSIAANKVYTSTNKTTVV